MKYGSHKVLIETYWNVKDFDEKNCVDLSLSINRNILECKDIASQNTAKSQESINRNILECKDDKTMFSKRLSKTY